MDLIKQFGLIYNPEDDTVTRFDCHPLTTTEAHNSLPNQTIFTQDIPLNPTHNTWLRLYTPITPPPPHAKLPLILYFHYGGFILCSVSETFTHDFCSNMAADLPAVVLSVGYRLAPENKLPAAYEDGVEALLWVRNQARSENPHKLLRDTVDLSSCYLMGSSAGGNLAYHVGLRASGLDLDPLVIKGYILDHPYFSGIERSGSELRLGDGAFPLAVSDAMWELSLPKGSDRDHEYCNPLVDGSYKEKIGMLGRFFVNTHGGDLFVDYEIKFVEMLERNGVSVVTRFEEGGSHCIEVTDPDKAKPLFAALKNFIVVPVEQKNRPVYPIKSRSSL